MFKNVYNRCKTYLNSYVTLGSVIIILFILLLPTFNYKEASGFFFLLRYNYQYSLVNALIIMLYIYNIWNYLHKNINIVYQVHRYTSLKKVIKNNISDIIFIGIVLEITFMILNISIAVLSNDGYYLSEYTFYDITNLSYLIYLFAIRITFISIISIMIYYIYYTNNKTLKLILSFIIGFNLLNFNNILPITMNTILSGYEFNSFTSEIISTLIMICIYIIGLVLIRINFINKKRDIG